MTPAAFYCTQQRIFCWRAQSSDLQTSWSELKLPKWDLPEDIVEGSMKAQHAILTGYKDNPKVNRQKLREAGPPKQVAISLTGEPTLYEHLGELIQVFHRKGFTTFLVSNGTLPQTLARINEEPTQLYISVCAPDEETFKHACHPQISKG
jgi:tRNA wybutosine-synthesizing protein 1